MGLCAAVQGQVEVLKYVRSAGVQWSAATLTTMLAASGDVEELDAASYIRQELGAEWLHKLAHEQERWPQSMVNWARAQGCTSPVLGECRTSFHSTQFHA